MLAYWCCSASGQVTLSAAALNSVTSVYSIPGPPADILRQDFTTGFLPFDWYSNLGSPQYNYLPSLIGHYSCAIRPGDQARSASTFSITNGYVFFEFLSTNVVNGSVLALTDTNWNMVVYCTLIGGHLNAADAGYANGAATTATMSPNVKYYVWMHGNKGTGSNSVISAAFSTVKIEPYSGPNFAGISNGNATNFIQQINTGQGPAGDLRIYDHIGLATFDMPTGW